MKLLFIHDHPFSVENNIVYSGGGLPSAVWDNYLKYFDEIRVIGRESLNNKNQRVVSSHNQVSFRLVNDYNSVSLINFPSYIRNLKKIFKEEIEKVDFVILRCPSFFSFMAHRIARKDNKKICIEQVGNAFEALWNIGSIKGKILAPINHFINKRVVRKNPYVTYVAEKLTRDYPTLGYFEVFSDVVIPYIQNIDELSLHRFRGTSIKIGLIGSFVSQYKGQDILLKSISTLDEKIQQNIELYFIGVGNYQWVLDLADKFKLRDNIKYIGLKKSGQEIFDFLSDLSLYLQPSLTEGMPRAMIEAMAMGCPVLASNVGGIPDIIDHNFLHKPGDYKALASHILRLYDDRKLLEKMAIENLHRAQPFLKKSLNEKRDLFYHMIKRGLYK